MSSRQLHHQPMVRGVCLEDLCGGDEADGSPFVTLIVTATTYATTKFDGSISTNGNDNIVPSCTQSNDVMVPQVVAHTSPSRPTPFSNMGTNGLGEGRWQDESESSDYSAGCPSGSLSLLAVHTPTQHPPYRLSLSSFGTELNASGRHHLPDMPPTHPDRTHHRREREVSSMGSSSGSSTGRSRSGLRLAKKERRQKARDGHGDVAFAGDNLGESFDDEGMAEIIVNTSVSEIHTPKDNIHAQFMSKWATPLLSSPDLHSTDSTDNATTSLRRGKRDLMRSWLDTPLEEQPNTPILHQHNTGQGCNDEVGTDDHMILSQACCAQDPPSHHPTMNIYLSDILLSVDMGQISSGSCSYCRDTLDVSPSISHHVPQSAAQPLLLQLDTTLQELTTTPSVLSLPAMAVCESGSSEYEQTLPDTPVRRPAKAMYTTSNRTTLHCVTPLKAFNLCNSTSDVLSCTNNAQILTPETTASLSLLPGPKPRNVVTFNADAYNLDAWDADVMGLFALPTEGVTNLRASLKTRVKLPADEASSASTVTDNSFGMLELSSSRPRSSPYLPLAVDTSNTMTSSSILLCYFEQSRQPITTTTTTTAFHHQPFDEDDDNPLNFETWASLSRREVVPHDQTQQRSTLLHPQPQIVSPRCLTSTSSATSFAYNCDIITMEYLHHVAAKHMKAHHAPIMIADPNDNKMVTSTALKKDVTSHVVDHHQVHLSQRSSSAVAGNAMDLSQFHRNGMVSGSTLVKDQSTISSTPFSDLVRMFVTVDAVTHPATSYTEQLANPTSKTGIPLTHHSRLTPQQDAGSPLLPYNTNIYT